MWRVTAISFLKRGWSFFMKASFNASSYSGLRFCSLSKTCLRHAETFYRVHFGGRKSKGQPRKPIAAGALQVFKPTGREKTIILIEKECKMLMEGWGEASKASLCCFNIAWKASHSQDFQDTHWGGNRRVRRRLQRDTKEDSMKRQSALKWKSRPETERFLSLNLTKKEFACFSLSAL